MLCVSLEMEADVDILQIHQRLKNACLAVRILSIKCLFWSCCYHLSLGLNMKLEGQNFRRFPPWTSSGHMVFFDAKMDGWISETVECIATANDLQGKVFKALKGHRAAVPFSNLRKLH